MSSYQMSSSILKYSYNPDKQSLQLKYFLAIKVNLSKLSQAYPKMVRSSKDHFYDRCYLNLWLSVHPHTLSLCLSAVLYTHPFFPFHINMTTVCILDYSYFDYKRLWTICGFTWGLAYNNSSLKTLSAILSPGASSRSRTQTLDIWIMGQMLYPCAGQSFICNLPLDGKGWSVL